MAEKQKTLKASVKFSGKGLHTGLHANLTIKPAPENHGYKFQRIDMEDKPLVEALLNNVVDTSRSTVIEKNGARIGTVEHLLSALYGMGIDNALIEIDAPEMPILDGSAKYYVEAFQKVGIEKQKAEKDFFIVKNNISYSDEEHGIEIMTFPDENFSMNVMIDYKSDALGNQYASLNSLNEYKEQISDCRTFVFFRELEILAQRNLIKGGDIDNAIVIVDKNVTQEEVDRISKLFNQPSVKIKEGYGILSNVDLKFSNEPARHKLLDLLGDLALLGMPIKGKILATRPGHYSNVQFAKKIQQEIAKGRSKNTAPIYDPTQKPLYTTTQVMNVLPHRPPFLLIDKIISLTETDVVGIKNVTMNEPFFVGHFPGEPVMPGVLMIEGMAQVGGILVLNTVPDPENYLTYFLKIDKVKFRRQVVPGDTLIYRLELIEPIRRGIAHMKSYAYVAEQLVAEGELMAQITKVK